MKKMFILLSAVLTMLYCFTGTVHAALTTIGTATYNGSDYNLIWDEDNNGNSVVWLDYTNDADTWDNQKAWAASLDTALTLNLYDGYTVDWDGSWRLPATVDGLAVKGYDGTTTSGYNITTSEMGHLYYEELGNLGYYDTSGNKRELPPAPDYFLQNTGDFDNLIGNWYWSGTDYACVSVSAWNFTMGGGSQNYRGKDSSVYGIAVRSGQVSAVPVPGAVWLLGSGLLGLIGIRRKRN
ncbi:MAG: PEP-CTERM sorting domain-containing protein [Desulfobacteraceae bacterium]|jgi:hypothetical protein